jgi:hypothetical protein
MLYCRWKLQGHKKLLSKNTHEIQWKLWFVVRRILIFSFQIAATGVFIIYWRDWFGTHWCDFYFCKFFETHFRKSNFVFQIFLKMSWVEPSGRKENEVLWFNIPMISWSNEEWNKNGYSPFYLEMNTIPFSSNWNQY